MPDDQLTQPHTGLRSGQAAGPAPRDLAGNVLAVLAGAPPGQAAARAGIDVADLADAVEVYKAAGYAALRARADSSWHQVRIQFTNWSAAEHTTATSLGPVLSRMENDGQVQAWWFVRKAPAWRLRLRPAGTSPSAAKAAVSAALDELAAAGLIRSWRATIYEPESAAFGGHPAMDIAHALFHADSRDILEYARQLADISEGAPVAGRRELSVLLCTALLHGAGQDWYEQGDVWHQVALMRPPTPTMPADRLSELAESLRLLLTADTRPDGALFNPRGPLTRYSRWAAAFAAAGRALGAAATAGTLERGMRGVLAHHVIFHWNRLGLACQTQAILARAVRETIMNDPSYPARAPAPSQ